ncbi:MAG TPA: hypothetical protein VF765_08670 [Polyangiaceae bacterium]
MAPEEPSLRSDIQVRLDAFRERATPVFTVEGTDVAVRIPFRMTVSSEWASDPRNATNAWVVQEHIVRTNESELEQAASAARLTPGDVQRLHEGRATPEQIRAVTQALIDAGHLPPRSGDAPDLQKRVEKMMADHGIGLDCAGYSQQAFLASRGLSRSATGLNPKIENENLSNLSGKGFARVSLVDARPGDLFILSPVKTGEAGHTMIVYDRREATPGEVGELRQQRGFEKGRIQAYVVDSSFGSDGRFDAGGVMRQVWYRNEETKTWARRIETLDPNGRTADEGFQVWPRGGQPLAERVYGRSEDPSGCHAIEGLYRPRGELR